MAPSKPRAGHDDSRSDASSTKDRVEKSTTSHAKGRRAGGAAAATSSLRDVTNASTMASTSANAAASGEQASVQWSTIDQEVLHSYRHAYQLNTPDAFSSEYDQLILSRPGIGRFSPTMARKKAQRRQSKDELANAVRKHFNGQGIQENEAIVDFLYKCKWQDKKFRMRFSPQGSR